MNPFRELRNGQSQPILIGITAVFTLERVLTEQGHMGAFQVAIDNSTS
jgi:hypothetical protein